MWGGTSWKRREKWSKMMSKLPYLELGKRDVVVSEVGHVGPGVLCRRPVELEDHQRVLDLRPRPEQSLPSRSKARVRGRDGSDVVEGAVYRRKGGGILQGQAIVINGQDHNSRGSAGLPARGEVAVTDEREL